MLHNRSRAVGSVLALTVTFTLLMGHKAARAETPIRPTPPEAKSAKTGAGAKGIDFGAVRPVPGNVWAVIVGVDYVKSDKKAHIPPLNYSVSDANLVRTALGLDETHLRFLTSDRDHCLTREEVITALKDMTKKAKAGDTVWFYFSGHGLVVKEGSYLVPEDFRWEDPTTCISVTEIRSILQDTQATARVVVLDACHSGATRDIQSTEWRPDFSPVSGTITMAACQPNQVAYEFPVLGSGHGGGVFTYYLVCGLYGGAENAQKKDGWVHLGDLRYWVGQQVKEECLRRGLHAPQEPVFLLPDGSNDARVAQVNPEKLKQMREQNMPSPAPLNVQRPIGPGLIVSVEGDDRTTVGTVESKLNNFLFGRHDRAAMARRSMQYSAALLPNRILRYCITRMIQNRRQRQTVWHNVFFCAFH